MSASGASFDLADESIRPSRRFTWEQGMETYHRLKALYREFGYEVIEVPVCVESDVKVNDFRMIDRILEHILS